MRIVFTISNLSISVCQAQLIQLIQLIHDALCAALPCSATRPYAVSFGSGSASDTSVPCPGRDET